MKRAPAMTAAAALLLAAATHAAFARSSLLADGVTAGSQAQGCTSARSGTLAFERTVYLTQESGSDRTNIWVVKADGSHQRKLTNTNDARFNARPDWSPDGQRIAFVSFRRVGVAHVMNRDGTRVRPLTKEYAWDPSWSPSGRQLVVTSDIGPVHNARLGFVSASGGRPVRWLTPEHSNAGDPDWSSEGEIAFLRKTGWRDETAELFVMRPDGSARRRLTHNRVAEKTPSWSPDGTKIAFHTDQGGLRVMNADGTGVRRLTDNPNDFSPAWSPDGSCLAFGREGTIYLVDLGGGVPRKLLGNKPRGASDASPDWTSVGG